MKKIVLFLLSSLIILVAHAQQPKTDAQLISNANTVIGAGPGQNTALRIGNDFLDLTYSKLSVIPLSVSGTNTYVASSLIISSYTNAIFELTFQNGNTGASTLNINSLGAVNLQKLVSGSYTALSSGDIQSNQQLKVWYDQANNTFQIFLGGSASGGGTVTSVSGTTNRITSTGGTTPVIDISASYVGQSSITTLGTIAAGTWQGTKVGLAYGGTNADLSATGGANQILKQSSSGAAITVAALVSGDIPNNAANTSGTAAAWTTGRTLSITGDIAYTSPSFDGTGNVTAAGTLATVNSNVGSFGSATQTGTFTVNGKGLITAASNVTITPAIGSITGLGTGVATALAVNTGSAGAFVLFNGALGTPSSGTLTNATGLPVSTGISGLGTGIATWLATPSSANLASALTDETGTAGSVVFSASPAFSGTLTYGTLGYSDTDIAFSFQKSVNSYFQIPIQNTNSGSTASVDLILNNDVSTATTHYGDLGMNSSGFTGSGSFNLANAVYLYASDDDLVFGTKANKSIHLLTNNNTTDAMTISGAGLYTITAPVKSNTIGGAFTATANSDYHWDFNATVTGRASQTADYVYGTKVDNTLKLGSNTQKLFNFYSTVANYANNGFTGQLGGAALFTGVVHVNASGNPVINGRAGIESSTTATPSNGYIDIQDTYPGIQFTSNGNATDRWFLFTGVQTLASGGGSTDLSFRCNSAGTSGSGDLFSLTKQGFYGFGNNSITQTLTVSSKIMQYRHKYTAPNTTATTTDYLDFSGETYTTAGTNQTYNHFNSNLTIALGSNTGGTVSGYIWNPTVTASVSYTNYGFRSQTGSQSGFGTLSPVATLQATGSGSIPTLQTIGVGTGTNYSYKAFQSDGTTQIFGLQDNGNVSINQGNLTLGTAGNKLFITEGSNGSVGQTTLVAGTKAITVTGTTTSSRCIVTLVSQAGTVTTTSAYQCACTSNTVTITAVTNAIATNTLDTSMLNYWIVN